MANNVSPRAASRRNLTIIIILLGSAMVLGTYFFFVAPARSTLQTTNSQLTAATLNLTQTQARYSAATKLGLRAGTTIYNNTSTLDNLLPQLCVTGYETSCFDQNKYWLVTLPTMVAASGLTLASNPTPVPAVYKTVGYYQFNITVNGSFAQLTSFVKNLVTTHPLTTVASISASATPKGVTATVVLDVWYINDLAHQPGTGPTTTTPAS